MEGLGIIVEQNVISPVYFTPEDYSSITILAKEMEDSLIWGQTIEYDRRFRID